MGSCSACWFASMGLERCSVWFSGVAGDQRIARLDLLRKGLRGARTGTEVRPVVRRVPAQDADVLATEAEAIGSRASSTGLLRGSRQSIRANIQRREACEVAVCEG
jgi:hypothetical protein